MKYCGNCRYQMQDHLQVCPRCGARVGVRGPTPQRSPQGAQYQYPPRVAYQTPRPAPQQGYYPPQTRAQPQPAPSGPSGHFCGKCGAPLRFISEYATYYCDRCMEYQSAAVGAQEDIESFFAEPGEEVPKEEVEAASEMPEARVESKREEEPTAEAESEELDIQGISGEEDERELEKKISAALKRVKEIIKEKDEQGYDITELEELYRQCGNVFAQDDFYTATHYLENIQNMLGKMELEEPPKDEDEMPTPQPEPTPSFDGTVTEIDYDSEVDDIDDGVVVVDSQQEPVDQWDLDDKPKMGDKEKAIHALESAKTAITDADEDGYDTTNAKKMFRDARPLYEAQDFKAVIDKVREAEREVLRVKGYSEREIQEILGEIPKEAAFEVSHGDAMSSGQRHQINVMISKIWVTLKEAERYGLDTKSFKNGLEKAKTKRKFESAVNLIQQIENELKNQLSSYSSELHDKASNMFHYVRSEIKSAERFGVEVAPFQDMLDRASTAISLTNYEEATNTMEYCLKKLKAAESEVQAQALAGSGAASGKSEPVWEPDEEDEDESEEFEEDEKKDKLDDEKRLKILEDRFILGEISETTYNELRNEILKRMRR